MEHLSNPTNARSAGEQINVKQNVQSNSASRHDSSTSLSEPAGA